MKLLMRVLSAAGFCSVLGGGAAFAEGTGETSAIAGMEWYTWVLIGFSLVCAVLTAWYWSKPRRKEARKLKGAALLAGAVAVMMGAFNASGMWEPKHKPEGMNLIQVYGVEYNQDGSEIMVATHEGIQWFETGSFTWRAGTGERHDYEAFAPYEGGFYGSGRPGPGSKLPNPLGLVKSSDNGKTLDLLALGGKVNFHLLSASYRKPVIYGYNQEANETLKQEGLYYTEDEGKTWNKCAMKGFQGDPTALAAAPDNGDFVALGARDGLFLSRDKGNSFVKLLPDMGISALSYDRDGKITVGGFKSKPSLLQLDQEGRQIAEIPLPELKEDAIAHTAHNPKRPEERVISTYEHDIYLSADGGSSWYQLAVNGKTKPKPHLVPNMGKK